MTDLIRFIKLGQRTVEKGGEMIMFLKRILKKMTMRRMKILRKLLILLKITVTVLTTEMKMTVMQVVMLTQLKNCPSNQMD